MPRSNIHLGLPTILFPFLTFKDGVNLYDVTTQKSSPLYLFSEIYQENNKSDRKSDWSNKKSHVILNKTLLSIVL